MDVVYTNNFVKPAMESEFDDVVSAKVDIGIANGKAQINDAGSRSISFHNITYAVEQRMYFKKRPPKVILNDVRYAVASYSYLNASWNQRYCNKITAWPQ